MMGLMIGIAISLLLVMCLIDRNNRPGLTFGLFIMYALLFAQTRSYIDTSIDVNYAAYAFLATSAVLCSIYVAAKIYGIIRKKHSNPDVKN